ncbi:MAG: hypothetical protein MJ239_02750 [Bacilli bacterium]|nr:hypothetical protein [Bacilli bacterium]
MKKTYYAVTLFAFLAASTASALAYANVKATAPVDAAATTEKPVAPVCPDFVKVDEAQVWDGTSVATAYEGGTGTESDPYQIATAAQFKYFQSQSNVAAYGSGQYYLLTRDIDLNGKEWTPISKKSAADYSYNFAGHLSGKYLEGGVEKSHMIANLSINKTTAQGFGLFHTLKNGSVKNLIITGALKTKDRVGTLTYYAENEVIENVTSYCNISTYGVESTISNIGYISGMVGLAKSKVTIDQSAFCGSIDNVNGYFTTSIGGFIGISQGANTVKNSTNYANIKGYKCTAGIVGEAKAGTTVQNCINTGNITSALYGGGIVAHATTNTITSCSNFGNIASMKKAAADTDKNAKGFAGINGWCTTSTTLTDCYVSDEVTVAATGNNSGYLAGYAGAGCVVDCEGSGYKILGTTTKPVGVNQNVVVTKYFGSTVIGYASLTSGAAYTPNDEKAAKPEGRTFGGWYLDAAFENAYVNGTALSENTALYGRFALPYATLLQNIKDVSSCTEADQYETLVTEISYLTEAEQTSILAESFEDHGGYTVTVAEKLQAMQSRLDTTSPMNGSSLLDNSNNGAIAAAIACSTLGIVAGALLIGKAKSRKHE